MWRYVDCALGAVLLAGSIRMRFAAMRRVFDCWRAADRRGWAPVAREMRRRWPFNAIATVRTYSFYEGRWRWSRPDWLRDSRPAMRQFRIVRFSHILAFAGTVLIIAGAFG
jgi:hypothetical protein